MENSSDRFQADKVLSYFKEEWKVLLAVAISGLTYNVGLLAGPWFEGKMAGCLVEILKGLGQYLAMWQPFRWSRSPGISNDFMYGALPIM